MFWVVGLLVTYQLAEFIVAFPPAIVSHTRVRADNKMAAAARNAGWRAIIAARNAAVEKIVWHDERSAYRSSQPPETLDHGAN